MSRLDGRFQRSSGLQARYSLKHFIESLNDMEAFAVRLEADLQEYFEFLSGLNRFADEMDDDLRDEGY